VDGKDNYKETRTMSKFSVLPINQERWQPYTASIHGCRGATHWGEIKEGLWFSTYAQFKPIPAFAFFVE
jgi:hypothetical protein